MTYSLPLGSLRTSLFPVLSLLVPTSTHTVVGLLDQKLVVVGTSVGPYVPTRLKYELGYEVAPRARDKTPTVWLCVPS